MHALSKISLILAALAIPLAARADLPTGADASRQAREAFAEGARAYDLGNWNGAIDAWQRAYTAKPEPSILYNLGQAARLAERYDRAIFFYKSYLRNLPNAKNRSEVEGRIAQIELLIKQKRITNDSPPNEPLQPGATPKHVEPPPPAPSTPPVAEPPPPAPSSAPEPPPAADNTVTKAPAPAPHERRGDLSVSCGATLWLMGVPGGAQPSAGVTLSGGYTVLARGAIELRIGALVGYSYLVDLHSTDHFLSVMVDPKLSFKLWRDKLYGFVEVGVGALVLAGVDTGSVLLKAFVQSPGTIAAFSLRPAIGVEYRVTPMLALFLAPAISYSLLTKSSITSSSVLQFDATLGLSLRL